MGDASDTESYESFRRRLDGAAFSTYAVVLLVVPLKYWCRKKVSGGWRQLGLENLLTLVSLCAVTANFLTLMVALRPYLGKHMLTSVPLASIEPFLKVFYAANFLYLGCIALNKLILLALYWKLFGVTRQARALILILVGVVALWLVAGFIVAAFSCRPLAANWDVALAASSKIYCIDFKKIYVGFATPNIITDFALVVLPIPYVWRLQALIAQRVLIAGMFTLGIFVSIVSVVRLSVLLKAVNSVNHADVTYEMRDVIIWSIVEINVGLICACLPSLRPMLRVIGLDGLFSFSGRSRPTAPVTEPPSGLKSAQGSFQKKKGVTNGLFTTKLAPTREDEFEMIGTYEKMGGKDGLDASSRGSLESDNVSHMSHETGGSQRTGLRQGSVMPKA